MALLGTCVDVWIAVLETGRQRDDMRHPWTMKSGAMSHPFTEEQQKTAFGGDGFDFCETPHPNPLPRRGRGSRRVYFEVADSELACIALPPLWKRAGGRG